MTIIDHETVIDMLYNTKLIYNYNEDTRYKKIEYRTLHIEDVFVNNTFTEKCKCLHHCTLKTPTSSFARGVISGAESDNGNSYHALFKCEGEASGQIIQIITDEITDVPKTWISKSIAGLTSKQVINEFVKVGYGASNNNIEFKVDECRKEETLHGYIKMIRSSQFCIF